MNKAIIFILCIILSNLAYGQEQTLSLEIVNGISIPNSNFKDVVENGFNNEFSISKSFCPKLSLAMGIKHSSFNVREEFGQAQGNRKQFRSLGFDLGPQFKFGSDILSVILYGRTGLSVNSTPELLQKFPNTDITTSSLKQQSIKALNARLGAKINTEICKGIQLFVSGEYVTSLNGDINFYTKDISKAIGADGRIDPDIASEIPTTSNSFNFNNLNVNFGVSMTFGKYGNHSNKRSSNPLYEQSGNSGNNPIYEQGISGGGGHSGQSSGTRSQDYNSSRSNKSSGISSKPNQNNSGGNRAQDHNSSRSNKTSAVRFDDNELNSNRNTIENQNKTQAQDYNSSRSNNIEGFGDKPDQSGSKAVQATDYNSSRSNNSSGIVDNTNENNPDGNKAQDYNSSRSNKSTVVEDDIRESMLASEKRKIKRKLRKEERIRLREEKKQRKHQASEIY